MTSAELQYMCMYLSEDNICVSAVLLFLFSSLQQHHSSSTWHIISSTKPLTKTTTVGREQLHGNAETLRPHGEGGSRAGGREGRGGGGEGEGEKEREEISFIHARTFKFKSEAHSDPSAMLISALSARTTFMTSDLVIN